MQARRLVIAVTAVNLVLVLVALTQGGSAAPSRQQAVVRAEVIELVDGQGGVRAQLKVEPTGEALFRMRDSTGAVRVKLGAAGDGSGLLLLNDATEPGVQALAKSTGTSLSLKGKGGRRRVIRPRRSR